MSWGFDWGFFSASSASWGERGGGWDVCMTSEWMLGARLGPQSGAVGYAEVCFWTEEEVISRGDEVRGVGRREVI